MTRLERLRAERADISRRMMDARARRQGTEPLRRLAHHLIVQELRLTVKQGKRK